VLLLSRPAAQALLEDYVKATIEHFEPADKLADPVGQHGQFEEQMEDVVRTHERCIAASNRSYSTRRRGRADRHGSETVRPKLTFGQLPACAKNSSPIVNLLLEKDLQ
jgi:hypothetical protein